MLRFAELHVVLVFDERERSPRPGSGVCVRIGRRFFIATCAHVVRGVPPDKLAVVTSFPAPDLAPRVLDRRHRGETKTDTVDVGWIELSPGAATGMGRWFLGPDSLSVDDVAEGSSLYVCGYPDEHFLPTRVDGRRGFTSKPIGYPAQSTCRIDPQFRPDRLHDLFIDYPKEVQGDLPAMWQRRIPDAPGLSGGGIWRPGWPPDHDWSPASARLVAIQRSWSPEARWLRGTLVRDWLQMMREDHPELAAEIDPVLDTARPA